MNKKMHQLTQYLHPLQDTFKEINHAIFRDSDDEPDEGSRETRLSQDDTKHKSANIQKKAVHHPGPKGSSSDSNTSDYILEKPGKAHSTINNASNRANHVFSQSSERIISPLNDNETDNIFGSPEGFSEVLLEKWSRLRASEDFRKRFRSLLKNPQFEATLHEFENFIETSTPPAKDVKQALNLCSAILAFLERFLVCVSNVESRRSNFATTSSGEYDNLDASEKTSETEKENIKALRQTIQNMSEEQKELKELLEDHYEKSASLMKQVRQEEALKYTEEILRLRKVIADNQITSSNGLAVESDSVVVPASSSYEGVEFGGLTEQAVSEQLQKLVGDKNDVISQLEHWKEMYAKLQLELRNRISDQQQVQEQLSSVDTLKEELSNTRIQLANLEKYRKMSDQAETEVLRMGNDITSLKVELQASRTVVDKLSSVIEEMQVEHANALEVLRSETVAAWSSLSQTEKKLDDLEEVKKENVDLKNKVDNLQAEIERKSIHFSRKVEENERMSVFLEALKKDIGTLQEEKEHYVDKRMLYNMIENYNGPANLSRKGQILSVICDVIDIPEVIKMSVLDEAGMPTSSERGKLTGKTLSAQFVDFLNSETQ